MKVLHTVAEFRSWRRQVRARQGAGGGGGGVGGARAPFVPTMGALHDGHASLVWAARELAGPADAGGLVLASIFVNPSQFGPQEDFAKYPRTLEADCVLLEAAGCDAVFVPAAEEMYPTSASRPAPSANDYSAVTVDAGPLGTVLEGAIRPGHFRGVCTVVLKLLHIVEPSHLLLGQKDFQQQAILRRMIVDLNLPVEVVTCPTLREADGLAMSSRNRYLSPPERARAVALYEALTWAKSAFDRGERHAAVLEAGMEQRLNARGLAAQYAVVADAVTLVPFREHTAAGGEGGRVESGGVLLIAAQLGPTRLIDNMLL